MHQDMHEESPSAIWVRFGVLSLLVLAGLLALIGFQGYSGLILLAWAAGSVLAASLILFRRR